VETYTRRTFGPHRYEIWNMQSAYHNLPLIDGHGQEAGGAYTAREVVAEITDDRAALSLDLAAAYPAAAGVAVGLGGGARTGPLRGIVGGCDR
jgi:hypothetical protein